MCGIPRSLAHAWLRLALCLFINDPITAADSTQTEEYAFDASLLKVKPLDASANIELYPYITVPNAASPQYRLKYRDAGPSLADSYQLKSEGYLRYKRKPLIAYLSGCILGAYGRADDSLYFVVKLYEGYAKLAPSPPFSILAGKRTFRWGKGYAYNPLAFAARPKDLNDIDAALEGYWNVSVEYVKSLDLPLSTIAVTAAILPVYHLVNRGYLPDATVAGVGQIYLLLADTDIDFCFFADSRRAFKLGIDFSRNLTPEWEIHGEWAHIHDSRSMFFTNETTAVSRTRPAEQFVAGTRYLAPFNTTFILEYLHLGGGYTTDKMKAYYHAIEYAIFAAPTQSQRIMRASMQFYNGQFIGTDYLYLKATHPDPFNLVYFTPALYAVINVGDGSAMAGFEMTYNRWRHLLLTGRHVTSLGGERSEYGGKPAWQRFELRAKWSF